MTKPATILVVDDEPILRDILEALLQAQGYNLALAGSGPEALAKVAEFCPDLILLDVMMPGMDGLEVCQILKAEKLWQHIPIILITALSSVEDLARGINAGADDFLHKPFDNLELLARVRSMLRLKSQYDALEEQRQKLETSLHLNEKFGRALAQHLAELELLHDVGLRLMNKLDMDSVLDLIAQAALEIIPQATGCVMHFATEDEQQLLPVTLSPEKHLKIVHLSVGIEEIARKAIKTKTLIDVPDVLTTMPQLPLGDMRALLVVPLIDQQHVLGTMTIYSSEANVFAENHQHILSILANQATVAITKARSIEERERLKEQEKWAIRDLFQRYVSPKVVDRLVAGTDDLVLGGKRQEVSVLFADLRGFTSFGENLAPEQLIKVLNQYLALAVEAILTQEGTLDKFMGDAVMAIFNAPLPQPDHTMRAVRAALAMQQAIHRYNSTITDENRLSFGIGIHSGQAIVGNIGTAQQMNYTAIGDTINLAKRLQEHARGGQIVLSQAAYEPIKNLVAVEELGPLMVKGRGAAVHVYNLSGVK